MLLNLLKIKHGCQIDLQYPQKLRIYQHFFRYANTTLK